MRSHSSERVPSCGALSCGIEAEDGRESVVFSIVRMAVKTHKLLSRGELFT
jgi:hypothetical protein